MNKRLHRVVFNAARGLRVVVQETARAAGKASGATALMSATVLMAAWPVSAQIVGAPGVPPNLRPTVLVAPNGVPLVNIQTPSAGGVSRNLYHQFDVQPRGVILNNSRTDVQTQLGGWVQGNPYLATGPARVILNEITSGNPTQLRGAIEVGGQRAEVIVANPAGIAVDGGTFINASRATLTTGTPQLNAFGGLDGYVVRGGTVTIDGAGLDARSTDYAAILARAVQVNAGIWANELKVVTGANQISADHAQATPTTSTGTPPVFALDVSHLGGMYANKIFLVGTEAGVGARNAGAIHAAGGGTLAGPGEFVVTAAGRLENIGTIQATGRGEIAAESLANSGRIASGGDLRITTQGPLGNTGGTLEAQSLQLASAGDIDNRGGTMRQTSGVGLTVTAPVLSNTAGGVIGAEPVPEAPPQQPGSGTPEPTTPGTGTGTGANTNTETGMGSGVGSTGTTPSPSYVPAAGTIAAAGSLLNDGGHLYAGGAIQLQTPQVNNSGGAITTTSLAASGPSFSNAGGRLNVATTISASVDRFDNTGGTLRAGSLQIASSGDLLNQRGQIESDGDAALSAGGFVSNSGGTLRAGNDATVQAGGALINDGSITAGRHATIAAGTVQGSSTGVLGAGIQADGKVGNMGDLRVTSAGALQARGTNLAAGNATLQGASIDLSSSTTRAANIALSATQGDVNTSGTTIVTLGTLSVTANTQASQTLVNRGGQLNAGQWNLDVSNLANTNGGAIVQTGTGATTITAPGAIDNSGGTLASHGPVAITAGSLSNTAGRILAAGDLSATTTGLTTNAGGTVQAGGAMVLSNAGLDNHSGKLVGEALRIDSHGGAFDNRGGQTLAAGELRIDANAIDNTAGLIRSGATTVLNAARVTNAATLGPDQGIEGRNVVIGAGHLNNNTGAIRADADVTITSSAGIDNTSGLISAGKTLAIVDPNAATPPAKMLGLVNTGGKLVANESLSIDAATFSADGQVASGRDLSIALTQDVVNHAELAANGNLRYTTTGNFTNHGKLLAGETLTIGGQNIDNTANAEMSADTTTVTASGTFTNRGLVDGHDTRIDAAEVRNLGTGRLYGDALSIGAGSLTNDAETVDGITRSATIAARDSLDIGAGTLTNRDRSLIFSAGDLYIGGALDANRYATGQGSALHNLSADIEALGHMSVSMAETYNRDVHIRLGTPTVTPSTVVAVAPVVYLNGASGLYPLDQVRLDPANGALFLRRPDGSEQLIGLGGYGVWTNQLVTTTDTATDLAPARLVAGGNLTVDGRLINQDSQVSAGGTLRASDYRPEQLTGNRTTTGFGYVINHKGEIGPPVALQIPPETVKLGAYKYESNTDATTGSAPARTGSSPNVDANAARAGGVTNPGALVEVPGREAGGIPMVVRTSSSPSAAIPTASLFNTRPDPGSRYLVETDSRFASYRNWLSSDYLLDRLGLDPDLVLKRLGDGFYEQRLIREQIAQLTGHRYLDGFQSDEEQYAALLSAGATFARKYGLRPGIALTAEQMAQLTSDIVWLVEQEVSLPGGRTERVLVPQVYVRVRPGDIDGSGALLSADAVRIRHEGDITNTGTIAGRTLVSIQADNIHNLGGRISGGSVGLTAKNDIDNIGGTIDARDALTLQAGRDINIRSTTRSTGDGLHGATGIDRIAGLYVSNPGGTLIASAGNDVNLIGAVISNQGTGGTTAVTAGNDIRLGTVRESTTLAAAGKNMASVLSLSGERGTAIATQGTTLLNAGRDIHARQASVDAGSGLLSVQAGRDIRIESGEARQSGAYAASWSDKGFLRSTHNQVSGQFDHSTRIGSRFSGGLVALGAKNDITIEGSHISGTQGVLVDAGRHLVITEGRNTTSASTGYERQTRGVGGLLAGLPMPFGQAGTTGSEVRTDTASASTLTSSQGGVSLQAGSLLHLRGVQIDAARDIDIHGGNVDIQGATNTSSVTGTSSSRSRGGLEGGELLWHEPGSGIHARSATTTQIQDSTLTRTTLSGANVHITAEDTLALAGTTIHTPGTLSLNAERLVLGTQTTEHRQSETRQGRDLAYQRTGDKGTQDQTTHYNQFNAGQLEIRANRVQAGLGARDSIEQLAQQPGMAWVGRLNTDPALRDRVDWVRIDEVHRHWDYHQQGLTPEGAAIVTLVTAYLTAGTASGIGDAVAAQVGGGTAVAGAVTAGVTTLASQASVAVLNHQGDIGAALRDLGSRASVKKLLTAIVTGGVLGSLNMNPTGLPTTQGGAQPFMTQLSQNLTAGAARAVIGTAINGGSFERNLREALRGAIVDTIAAQGANAVGDLTAAGTLNDFTNKFAHAIVGCVSGAARADSAGGCGAGALGAAIGELAAEAYGRRSDTVQFAALMSGLAVAITGGDAGQIHIASQAGSNAAANNYLNHADASRMYALYQRCTSTSRCTRAEADEFKALQAKDQETTAAFNACAGDTSARCNAIREEFREASRTYLPTRGEVLVWAVNKANESGGRFSTTEIYEAYNANVFGVPPEISTGDLSGVADWVRGEISKEPPLSRIAMGLASYQNEQWAHYFGVNMAANLMAQARSMARPEPLTDKRPPTIARDGELLDSNGDLIGLQNPATGQWAPVLNRLPAPASPVSVVYKDPATGLSAYNPTGSVSRAEIERLAYDPAAKKPRIGEGSAAAEFQNAFGVRLERIDPKDYPPGKPRPDFKIVEGPNAGMTVDFMFTVESPYAATNMNRNLMASPRAALELRDQIAEHLTKAQIVPLDFRNLTADNQALLMHQIINQLPPAQRARIQIIR